jgi:hypothetical protein
VSCLANMQCLHCGAYTDPFYTIVNPLTPMADRSQMQRRYAKLLQGEAPSRQKGACRPRLGSNQAHNFEGCR